VSLICGVSCYDSIKGNYSVTLKKSAKKVKISTKHIDNEN